MLNSVIPAKAGTALTPAEADLLAAFRAAADDAQPIMVSMMQSIAAGSPRQRPALTVVPVKPRPRATGSGLVEVLLAIIVFGLFVYAVIFIPTPPAPVPQVPESSQSTLYMYLDADTGCQYIGQHNSSAGITPRIAADGKTHMGCKRSTS